MLYLLCIVQGCERFAFFAVLPLFVLYLIQHIGLIESASLLTLGFFLALSYLGALPGGMLLDRALGKSLGTLLGCVLLLLGYAGLASDRRDFLWPSLGLALCGHSLFKPGLNALASVLYSKHDSRRERGFLFLHFAVNIGALLGPVCGEWARAHRGWPHLFLCATVAMLAATVATTLGYPWLRIQPIPTESHPIVWLAPTVQHTRSRALALLCGVSIIFWLTTQQAGSSLALFAESHTALQLSLSRQTLTVGPGHFAALHALFVLVLTPTSLYAFGWLRRHGAAPSAFAKMAWGYLATAAAFAVMGAASLSGGDSGRVGAGWLGGCYVLFSIAELLISPIGLSLVSQLAPPDQTARWIGGWLVAIAVGNALAGAVGMLWGWWPHHRFFGLLSALALFAAFVLIARLRQLEAVLSMND